MPGIFHGGRSVRRTPITVPVLESLEARLLLSYTFSSIASFQGTHSGVQPSGLVMDSAGNLFGTTARGGAKGYGTIFEISATDSTHTLVTLASFTGADGIYPTGQLVLDADGNIVGTTVGGGASRKGTVFSLNPNASAPAITTIASFDGVNGSYPLAGVVIDGEGNLYGTAYGATHAKYASSVWEIEQGSGTITKLATFKANTRLVGNIVVDSAGTIFGTTQRGGTKNLGTFFQIPAGGTVNTLVSFTGVSGAALGSLPGGNLVIDSSGNVFGTTWLGGTKNSGTLFRWNASASTLTTLASFQVSDGQRPVGNLVLDSSGSIFGVTATGGAKRYGAIFEFPANATTSTVTTLFSFRTHQDGLYPSGPFLMDADGNFWGTTYLGGAKNRGTVFELATEQIQT